MYFADAFCHKRVVYQILFYDISDPNSKLFKFLQRFFIFDFKGHALGFVFLNFLTHPLICISVMSNGLNVLTVLYPTKYFASVSSKYFASVS